MQLLCRAAFLRCLWGRAAVCAGGRRPAREIATREPAARSGRSRSPPVPSGPSGALHTSGAWLLCVARRVGSLSGQAPPWPAGITNLSRETGVAFARAGLAPTETAIAFAGEKWAFWVRFSVAVVLSVSMVAVLG